MVFCLVRAQKGLPPKPQSQSILDDVSTTLPQLAQAVKLQTKAGKVGFDWNDPLAVLEKIEEEISELRTEIKNENTAQIEGELGDLLFALANLARHMKIDPDTALRSTNMKFRKRFGYIEKSLSEAGKTLSEANLEEMDALWNEAKVRPI